MNLQFSTKVSVIKDHKEATKPCLLKWEALVGHTSQGIHNLSPIILDQEIEATFEHEVPNGPDDYDMEEYVDIISLGSDVEIEYEDGSEFDIRKSVGLIPVSVRVTKNRVVVVFSSQGF